MKSTQRITITENEVNGYLTYDSKEQLPSGVVEPSVTILGTGRLAGRAVVDLDVLEEGAARPRVRIEQELGGRLALRRRARQVGSRRDRQVDHPRGLDQPCQLAGVRHRREATPLPHGLFRCP